MLVAEPKAISLREQLNRGYSAAEPPIPCSPESGGYPPLRRNQGTGYRISSRGWRAKSLRINGPCMAGALARACEGAASTSALERSLANRLDHSAASKDLSNLTDGVESLTGTQGKGREARQRVFSG